MNQRRHFCPLKNWGFYYEIKTVPVGMSLALPLAETDIITDDTTKNISLRIQWSVTCLGEAGCFGARLSFDHLAE